MIALLDTKQVCARYGITPKTLVFWKKSLKLPYFDFGKVHRYSEDTLTTWERSYMVQPAAPEKLTTRPVPQSILLRSMNLSSNGRDDR